MSKTTKILEARHVVAAHIRTIEKKLSRLLTPKQMKSIEDDLKTLRMSGKILGVDLMQMDIKLKEKLEKLSEDE
jgi:hypothetical protein